MLPLALPRARAFLLCARRGAALAGAVPLVLTRRWGMASAWSLPFGTYGGPLVDPGDPDPAAVRATLALAFNARLALERVARGEVVAAPSGANTPDPAWAALATTPVRHVTHVVSLAGRTFEEYASGLRHETRKGLRRAEREEVRVEEDPRALAEAHALYLEQARSWPGHRPYSLAFLRALVDHPSRLARLFAARRGGELVCAILVLTCGDEAFLWWSGASPQARSSLAYPYLIVEIARAMAAEGKTRVNIGSSGEKTPIERFKESLGAEPHPVWVYPIAPRSRLLRWALAWKRAR